MIDKKNQTLEEEIERCLRFMLQCSNYIGIIIIFVLKHIIQKYNILLHFEC